jgi:methylated-DNA-[protein]-cysteine S-methyltransferase
MKVWKELIEIPYGRVNTYKELARNIGNPNAFRAVGNAVGSNPIPIIIPCHRIVASNGLGGYSAGLRIKMTLLKLEGAIS